MQYVIKNEMAESFSLKVYLKENSFSKSLHVACNTIIIVMVSEPKFYGDSVLRFQLMAYRLIIRNNV